MNTFEIEIKETLSRVISIKAESQNEAILKANEMYRNEEIVLDYDDLINTYISPSNEREERDKLITDVLQYLYLDEKKHYEESDKPENHIYKKLERLKFLLD